MPLKCHTYSQTYTRPADLIEMVSSSSSICSVSLFLLHDEVHLEREEICQNAVAVFHVKLFFIANLQCPDV